MGEGETFLKKSLSFPHTPILSKNTTRIGVFYFVAMPLDLKSKSSFQITLGRGRRLDDPPTIVFCFLTAVEKRYTFVFRVVEDVDPYRFALIQHHTR